MARFFGKTVGSADFALLILRLAVGSMMLVHGYDKVLQIISGDWSFPDPLGFGAGPSLILAAVAEFLCMIPLILGFRTRVAVILPLITMLVAAVVVNSGEPWGEKEPALLYAASFFALLLAGGGKISLDSVHRERRTLPPLR